MPEGNNSDHIKPFFYEGNEDLPRVELNKDKGIFEISGKSLPEDVNEFYTPVIQWFETYKKNPNEETYLDLKFEYLNSGSYRMVFMVIQQLEDLMNEGHKVGARWHYDPDDEDLREEGYAYAEKANVPFEFIKL